MYGHVLLLLLLLLLRYSWLHNAIIMNDLIQPIGKRSVISERLNVFVHFRLMCKKLSLAIVLTHLQLSSLNFSYCNIISKEIQKTKNVNHHQSMHYEWSKYIGRSTPHSNHLKFISGSSITSSYYYYYYRHHITSVLREFWLLLHLLPYKIRKKKYLRVNTSQR